MGSTKRDERFREFNQQIYELFRVSFRYFDGEILASYDVGIDVVCLCVLLFFELEYFTNLHTSSTIIISMYIK